MEEEKTFLTAEEFDAKTSELKEEIKAVVSEALEPLEKDVAEIKVTASQREEDKVEKGGFANFGEFAKSVQSSKNGMDEKLGKWINVATKTLNEGIQSDGGFTVPPEFSRSLWERGIETSQFYSRCFDIPTSSNEYHLPALVDESHASSLYGGVTLSYKAEEAAYSATYPKFREIEWKLNKLTGLTYISDEMLEDSSQNMSAVISRLFSDAMAWYIDKDILTGSGAGKPLGILYAPSIIDATAVTGQVADTVVYQNLVNMWVRSWRKGNLVWGCNSNVLAQLMTMSIEGGTASTPVWIPGNDASVAPNGSIFGKPIIESEHFPTIGDTGDIMLIDFSQYGVAHKNNGGVKTATSMHLKFDYDQLAFKISFRWDGQSMWNSAFTPANGDTKSPFIKLAAR